MVKPVALYYSVLQFQPDNIAVLREHFELIERADPRDDDDATLSRTEVLFAPLGFTIDEAKLRRCPRLRAIISGTTAVPHIDMAAAGRRSIAVCALHDQQSFLNKITPTAEHTIGLMIAAWRRLPAAHAAAASGAWDRRPWGAPRMLSRMRLGIVGYGRLGQKVADIAQAMGMTVSFYDPGKPGSSRTLIDLARRSDVLSLHAPATPATQNLVSREVIEALPPGSMIINTARGELLDTDALLDGLASHHLYAAALDTVEGEYDPEFPHHFADHRLARYAREHNNLILTPHIGGSTIDAWSETERHTIDLALRAL